jgi:hypothetical protein
MNFKPGTWTFWDRASSSGTIINGNVKDVNDSTIKAAFLLAQTTLAAASLNTVLGKDPKGKTHRGSSISMG